MSRGYSSGLVADYILRQANIQRKKGLTQFQLIKLVYIAHGRHLAYTNGKPLISDRIEAWKHGPVIPVLYQSLKVYGDNIIPELRYCGTSLDKDSRDKFFEGVFDKDAQDIMDSVIHHYGNWDMREIYTMCHAKNTPWDQCYTGEYNVEIPDNIIQDHFMKELITPVTN